VKELINTARSNGFPGRLTMEDSFFKRERAFHPVVGQMARFKEHSYYYKSTDIRRE
jgi:hypothetical protein